MISSLMHNIPDTNRQLSVRCLPACFLISIFISGFSWIGGCLIHPLRSAIFSHSVADSLGCSGGIDFAELSILTFSVPVARLNNLCLSLSRTGLISCRALKQQFALSCTTLLGHLGEGRYEPCIILAATTASSILSISACGFFCRQILFLYRLDFRLILTGANIFEATETLDDS